MSARKARAADDDARPVPGVRAGLAVVATAAAALTLATLPFLRRFSGAPYVASSAAARRAILAVLRERASAARPAPRAAARPRLVDLGSGSGELVLDAARAGYVARGVDLNPWLVLASRARARRARVAHRASFAWEDMWRADVRDADAVTVFGVPGIMQRVADKVERECRDGCVVCCNSFDLPGWRAVARRGGVAFYEVGRAGSPPRRNEKQTGPRVGGD